MRALIQALMAAAVLLAGGAILGSYRQTDLAGSPRIIDGDTIVVNGVHVRLLGIDAPEREQRCGPMPCGHLARDALGNLIGPDPVRCAGQGLDRYGRLLATCTVKKLDIGRFMVQSGWAVAYLRYSRQYEPEQIDARAHRRGIWATEFEMPDDWRRRHRK